MKLTHLNRVVHPLALLAGCGLLAFGFWHNDLFAQMAQERSRDALHYALGATLLAWLLKRLLKFDFGRALAGSILAVHLVMVGLAPTIATLVLALVGLAIGTLALPARSIRHAVVALLIGLGLIAGIIGWLLPHEIHYVGVYACSALLVVIWRRNALHVALAEIAIAWRRPWILGWEGWLGLIVVGYCATAGWMPTVQSDDLASHLSMPWQLADYGYYRFDVASQVWAVTSWSSDVLHAVAQVLAGTEARGALDSLWLLAAVTLIWQLLAGLGIESRWRWLAVAMFASQPLTHALMQSMQTELVIAAVLLAMTALVLDDDAVTTARTRTLAFSALVGFALGLKVSTLIYLAPMGLWFLWRQRRLPWGSLPLAVLLLLLAAGSSYAYAAILTGNPVLPLFNDVFGSSDAPQQAFTDPRFQGAVKWTAPYDLVVHTSRYFESWDGAAGFQWLALLGTLILALRLAAARALWLVAVAGLVAMYFQMQYLRYLFPLLALLSVTLVQSLTDGGDSRWRRMLVLILVALNVAAMSNAIWTLREPPLSLWRQGRTHTVDDYLRKNLPERLLIRHLRGAYGQNYSALILGDPLPYHGEAAGHAFSGTWYDPWIGERAQAANDDATGAAYARLFDDAGATHVLAHPITAPAALLTALNQRSVIERKEGDATLYRIERAPVAIANLPAPGGSFHSQPLRMPIATDIVGPLTIDVQGTVRCAPYDAAVALRIDGMTRKGIRQIAIDYQRCGNDGRLQVRASANARSADGLLIWLEPGGQPAPASFAVDTLEAHVRHDLSAQRDRHRELRP